MEMRVLAPEGLSFADLEFIRLKTAQTFHDPLPQITGRVESPLGSGPWSPARYFAPLLMLCATSCD